MYDFSELKASCSIEDPERWFSVNIDDVEFAKARCNECVFKLQCLEDTMAYEELSGEPRYGTFGGLTARERNKLRSKRKDRKERAA